MALPPRPKGGVSAPIYDESRFEKYAFKDECQLTQIFPDYGLSLDEYIEEFKF